MTEQELESLENPVIVRDVFGVTDEEGKSPYPGPHLPHQFARKLHAIESLGPLAEVRAAAADTQPYSLQWFLDIENKRHSKHGRWIPKLLEFSKHDGETLLGLGHGLGTDWVQYARHGAHVIVSSPSSTQLELVRQNFRVRQLSGQFLFAKPTNLPLENSSVDVVCLSSLHHGIDDPKPVLEEVFRVLRPGGKVIAVTPAKYDIDYWVNTVFFWNRWLGLERKRRPSLPTGSSRWDLAKLLAKFEEFRFYKRQLRRYEVPHVWRVVPSSLLARVMGRVLIVKAFKPVLVNKVA